MNEIDRNDPTVWMLLLERGRQTGNFDLAARARHELELLGVRVSYRRLKSDRSHLAREARHAK